MSSATPPAATEEARTTRRETQEGIAAPPKLRRRPMLIAVSIILTAVGALLAAYLLQALSDTDEVVAVREGVSRGEKIEENDLVQASVGSDMNVQTLSWGRASEVIGSYAKYDLPVGSLVTPDSFAQQIDIPANQAVVGMALEPGRMPSSELRTGDQVFVVYSPNVDSGRDSTETYLGYVVAISPSPDGRGSIVDVAVRKDEGPKVAAASLTGNVSLMLNSRDKKAQDAAAQEQGLNVGDPTTGSTSSSTSEPSS